MTKQDDKKSTKNSNTKKQKQKAHKTTIHIEIKNTNKIDKL